MESSHLKTMQLTAFLSAIVENCYLPLVQPELRASKFGNLIVIRHHRARQQF